MLNEVKTTVVSTLKEDISKVESIIDDMNNYRLLDSTQKSFLNYFGGEELLNKFESIENIFLFIHEKQIEDLKVIGLNPDGEEIDLPFEYFSGDTLFERIDNLLTTIEINTPESLIIKIGDRELKLV